ncbi:MAG: hypothetical protein KGR24_08920 [Planctomycetes bacterium]|nr:hypothetical protein [Planctomycetota bacterium]
MHMSCRVLRDGVVLAMCLLCGCGDPSSVATVSGTITHGGKPVSGVCVQFVPNDKTLPLATGAANEAGRYTLNRPMGRKGCAAGTYSVRLFEQEPGSLSFTIPAGIARSSTLTFDVKSGANTFDIEIPASASSGDHR